MKTNCIFSIHDILQLSQLSVQDAKLAALHRIIESNKSDSSLLFFQASMLQNNVNEARSTSELVNRLSDYVPVH